MQKKEVQWFDNVNEMREALRVENSPKKEFKPTLAEKTAEKKTKTKVTKEKKIKTDSEKKEEVKADEE